MKESKKNKPSDPELEILDKLPPKDKKVLKELVSVTVEQMWSAPLPPPEIFNKYPRDVRIAIIKQADSQMKHRQKIENKVIDSNIQVGRNGMNYAFWITIIMVVAGVILIVLNKQIEGLVALFGPTAFHGGNFLFQKWQENKKIDGDIKEANDKHVRGKNDEQKTLQSPN